MLLLLLLLFGRLIEIYHGFSSLLSSVLAHTSDGAGIDLKLRISVRTKMPSRHKFNRLAVCCSVSHAQKIKKYHLPEKRERLAPNYNGRRSLSEMSLYYPVIAYNTLISAEKIAKL